MEEHNVHTNLITHLQCTSGLEQNGYEKLFVNFYNILYIGIELDPHLAPNSTFENNELTLCTTWEWNIRALSDNAKDKR